MQQFLLLCFSLSLSRCLVTVCKLPSNYLPGLDTVTHSGDADSAANFQILKSKSKFLIGGEFRRFGKRENSILGNCKCNSEFNLKFMCADCTLWTPHWKKLNSMKCIAIWFRRKKSTTSTGFANSVYRVYELGNRQQNRGGTQLEQVVASVHFYICTLLHQPVRSLQQAASAAAMWISPQPMQLIVDQWAITRCIYQGPFMCRSTVYWRV